jgi:hypothetical protein
LTLIVQDFAVDQGVFHVGPVIEGIAVQDDDVRILSFFDAADAVTYPEQLGRPESDRLERFLFVQPTTYGISSG